jgi:hypothetical protein
MQGDRQIGASAQERQAALSQMPPVEAVEDLIKGHVIARTMHVVAEYGVADVLDEAPAPVAKLAERTGLNADALGRMLRLLAAHGVFERQADGYGHTPASRLLRSDHPQSLRALARMLGMPVIWNDFTELGCAASTGRPALDWAGLMAHFAAHPEEAHLFNQAMVAKASAVVPAVVAAYDFTPFNTVADIGGGRGHLLQAILERVPTASGVLFELPHVVADAAEAASPRLRLQAGDFFADPLPAADGYVLMEIVHDWADADAGRILAAVRRAAPAGARLLIVEAVIPQQPGPHLSLVLDIIMLALTGGRERTPSEYETLLEPAGFRIERIVPTLSPYSVVEAIAT